MKRKLPLMLLALVCAVMVWLYDVTIVNPNDTATYSNIPVTLENEDALRENGLMVLDGDTLTVSLRIYGRRSELKKLNKGNISVTADLSELTEAGTHELSYSVSFPANVSAGDLNIENRSPAYVPVTLEHYIRKAVEIRTVFEGDAQAQNGELVIDTDAMTLTPGEIQVTGPAELVEQVDCARILINKGDITKTTTAEYEYELLDKQGEVISMDELVTDYSAVSVSIPVQKYKEIPLTLKLQPGGGATKENISYTLSADTIKISGEAAQVDKLLSLELGTLDFASIVGPTTKTYPVTLPEGINNASGLSEISVDVKVVGLNITTLTVSDFTLVHVPEGLNAEAISESVSLTLRGSPGALGELEEKDIQVSADLSGLTQPGTYIVPVTVAVPSGLQVGAIGSNTITVTIS